MINLKIRINVDEQVLALPVDTQFVPGIPEKDGAYYRADYTFVVTKGGVDEVITQTKYKTA